MGFTEGTNGIGGDDLGLPRAAIIAEQLAIGSAAVDDVWVGRIGRDIAALARARGVPVTEGDGAVIAAADNKDAAAILLRAVDVVRELVVHSDMVELRRRLVVPAAPAASAIHAHARALVAAK